MHGRDDIKSLLLAQLASTKYPSVETYILYAHVLACTGDNSRAAQILIDGLTLFPENPKILKSLQSASQKIS